MKALINYEIASAFSKATGIDVIPLPPYARLDFPVASHADMLFCVLNKVVFCYEDYIKENNLLSALMNEGYEVVFVSHMCQKDYPNDISLNVLVMGKLLFCNQKYTAQEILLYAKNNGYSVVDVKQGYSACSTLVLDANTAITSDFGMAKAIEATGKRVLLINCDDILLPGYNHGFIGGATAMVDEKIVVFGELDNTSFKEKLELVAKENKVGIFSILSGRVYDFGGVKLI